MKVSPFLIEKSVTACAGSTVMDIRKMAGCLFETLTNQKEAWLLMSKEINEIAVEVSPYSTLNTTNGVVVCRILLNCTEKEIVTELAPQGVTACQGLTICREEQTLPSTSQSWCITRQPCQRKYEQVSIRLAETFYLSAHAVFSVLTFWAHASRCAWVKTCFCGKLAMNLELSQWSALTAVANTL